MGREIFRAVNFYGVPFVFRLSYNQNTVFIIHVCFQLASWYELMYLSGSYGKRKTAHLTCDKIPEVRAATGTLSNCICVVYTKP
jgi:hypothetical protein